ncbi:hypothetical protein BMI87_21545 [Thioclava sp. F28-4]|nr:hypothetical protein BMI87_21545 [Thioclava sp. F28-4]
MLFGHEMFDSDRLGVQAVFVARRFAIDTREFGALEVASEHTAGISDAPYLKAIAAGHPQGRIDELLPWNFKPSS